MSDKYKYDRRGVSATKDEVHQAIKNLDKGLYPRAFCKIIPDYVAGHSDYCNLMHADTAGTKTSLAYLYWKETGDLKVWEGIAQDAIVMNLDDMGCVGCADNVILSSTIGRNKHLIDADVISTIINATQDFVEKMNDYGIRIHLSGGETADVGDIVRTIDVGYTAFARMKRSDLIVNDIRGGDVVVGLASFGKTIYENAYNAGMGSNGLTSARHDVLGHEYAGKYPESFDPHTPEEIIYVGTKKLTDTLRIGEKDIEIGKLLLSPTRTYLPFIKRLIAEYRSRIHGMIHNTGGGQTKVIKFVDQKRVVKNDLFGIPPLFRLIQEEAGTAWKEMYQVFNMGHRLEVYLSESDAPGVIDLASELGIEAKVVGYVEEAGQNSVRIESPAGKFDYH